MEGRSRASNNQIISYLWLGGITLLWGLSSFNFLYFTFFVFFYLGALSTLSVYLAITSFWHYRMLTGEFKGQIEFDEHSIIIDGQSFHTEGIKKIDFSLGDYAGKDVGMPRTDFNPRLSNGVDNYVRIKTKQNNEIKVYFKLDYKNHEEQLYPFISRAIQLGKIPFLRGIDLLKITDYDEIQEFKKQRL